MKTVKRPAPTVLSRFYLKEVLSGLTLTLRHVVRNLFKPDALPTVFYPEENKALPEANRGRHRLMKREDGSTRCTACMLCATNCPAECIHIKAAESADPMIEKYPDKFDIDLLRCVFCGLCVEACPLDAIRMDLPQVVFTGYTRDSFILDKAKLLAHDNGDIVPGYNPERPTDVTHGPHARP